MKPIVSKKIRQSARGQSCTLRSPHCNDNGENVMLCHVPLPGMAGMGQKMSDIHGFYGCEGCHRYFDTEGRADPERWQMAFRAVVETQNILYELGLITVK